MDAGKPSSSTGVVRYVPHCASIRTRRRHLSLFFSFSSALAGRAVLVIDSVRAASYARAIEQHRPCAQLAPSAPLVGAGQRRGAAGDIPIYRPVWRLLPSHLVAVRLQPRCWCTVRLWPLWAIQLFLHARTPSALSLSRCRELGNCCRELHVHECTTANSTQPCARALIYASMCHRNRSWPARYNGTPVLLRVLARRHGQLKACVIHFILGIAFRPRCLGPNWLLRHGRVVTLARSTYMGPIIVFHPLLLFWDEKDTWTCKAVTS